jgi:hypothetical protein
MSKLLTLRRVLLLDAAVSGATGLLMLASAGLLGRLLGVPDELLRWAGASLVPFAAFVAFVATRQHIAARTVHAVMALNAAWVLASVAVLLTGAVAPNGLGVGFILFQAAVVAAFVEMQYLGLRRTREAAA